MACPLLHSWGLSSLPGPSWGGGLCVQVEAGPTAHDSHIGPSQGTSGCSKAAALMCSSGWAGGRWHAQTARARASGFLRAGHCGQGSSVQAQVWVCSVLRRGGWAFVRFDCWDPVCLPEPPAHVSFLLDLSCICAEHWARRVVGLPARQGPSLGAPQAALSPPERPTGHRPLHTLSSLLP